MRISLSLVLCALLALLACAPAQGVGVGVLTPEQTAELVRQMHEHREMERLSADSELDLALLESGAETRNGDFILDDTEPRVMVEADAAAEEAQAPPKAAPVQPAAQASGPPSSAGELLQPRLAGHAGSNTFFDAPTTPTRPERERVTAPRIARAKFHLAKRAHQEHVKEYEMYQRKLAQYNWARAVEQGRQAPKFQRKLHNAASPPAASSNAASMNGDRVHNTLFPAATAKSDGKAAAVQRDFQHKGYGDAYANHAHMVGDSSSPHMGSGAAGFVKPTIDASLAQLHAQTTTEQAPKAKASKPATPAKAKGAMPPGPQEPANLDPPLPNDGMPAPEAGADMPLADGQAPPAAAGDDNPFAAPGDALASPAAAPAAEGAPQTAQEPCAAQCDLAGGWRTAACQDCLMRGMVNGWIVRSIADAQRGYNYAHYARNKCVAYVNELQLRGGEVKGAPFAHCFFQRMHETCNL